MANLIDTETLQEIADRSNGDVRYDYSGRGMHGTTCVGIVLNDRDLLHLGAAIAELVPDETVKQIMMSSARQDNMGSRTIVYWEMVTCE
jgi:hypothetical protein